MEKNGSQPSFREMSTIYSHAFLVGEVEYRPTLEKELDQKVSDKNEKWKRDIVNKEDYIEYYEGHLKSMLEVEGEESPDFLKSCRHYSYDLTEKKKDAVPIFASEFKYKQEKQIAIKNYYFRLCCLHVYILPLNTVILAIEIDDSNSNLDDLTIAHSKLMTWNWGKFCEETKKVLKEELDPIKFLLPKNENNEEDWTRINLTGAKMKIFQLVEMPIQKVDDALLYEIATSTPIGSVNCEGHGFKPSKSYFDMIMKEHSISAFDNWKALALNDSLTCLFIRGVNSYVKDNWIKCYFPLIYLKAYFEKHFCFNRNIQYRCGNESKNLIKEMAYMEKYYFYDNISYNFLPNLIYEKVKFGLGIDLEKRELSEQIKNDEQKQENIVMGIVAVFAIISIMCDASTLAGLIGDWGPLNAPSNPKRFVTALFFTFAGLVAIIWLIRWLLSRRFFFRYTRIGRFVNKIFFIIKRKK